MLAFLEEHPTEILTAAVIMVVILVGLCLVAKLFKLAIGLLVIAIVVPVLFTIFWGDGHGYVQTFASFFSPKYQQQIESAYDYYREKDSEDPVVDYDAVSDAVTDLFDQAKEKGKEWLDGLPPLPETIFPANPATPPNSTGAGP